ncbi:MAG: hypothetical protein AB7N76_29585 [Planctomycetota bacterium]
MFVLVIVIPRLFPVQTYATWCRWRYGAAPSANGLVLTIAPAPPGTEGEGPGPWLALELHNIEDQSTVVQLLDPPGDEWIFRVEDAQGRRLPPAGGPERQDPVRPLRQLTLPAGARTSLVVDLSRWVAMPPGPGQVRVVVTKMDFGAAVALGDGHRCESQPLQVALP